MYKLKMAAYFSLAVVTSSVLIEQLVLDEIIRLHQVLVCPIIFILHLVPNRMSWLITSPHKSNYPVVSIPRCNNLFIGVSSAVRTCNGHCPLTVLVVG